MSNTFFDLNTLSIAQLAAVYNAAAVVKVNKFSTKPIALKRIEKLCEELTLTPANVDGEPVLIKRVAEELPKSRFDVGAPGKVEVESGFQMDPFTEVSKHKATPTASKPPAAPAPAAKALPTPYEVQQAKKAKRSKAKADSAAAPTATGSQRSEYAEAAVITVKQAPKARDGSNRAARAACLQSGMTVGAYLDAAHKAHGGKARARHRFHADLHRYVAAGIISIK